MWVKVMEGMVEGLFDIPFITVTLREIHKIYDSCEVFKDYSTVQSEYSTKYSKQRYQCIPLM